MSAFATALNLLFADPNLAYEAWHRDCEGRFTRIRIIPKRADTMSEFGLARLVSDSFQFDVRVCDLPYPKADEQILWGEDTYLIQGEPVRDRERLIWTVTATPA
jgi:hypothetical protein